MPYTEKFWQRARMATDTESCWVWTGPRSGGKTAEYGMTGQGYAHRLAFEKIAGPIPLKMTIDHLCRVKLCVNPWHMEIVPHRTNNLRGDSMAARNARKVDCIRGHRFDERNTYYRKNGSRDCRRCNAERNAGRH